LLALRLAASAPLATAAIKRLLRTSLTCTLTQQLNAEAETFATNAASADFLEALAAFFEKRAPQFRGA
jgi:2-(1,2-epoxy-1,2-dihydrophenyl)acetyl-CoA isomerase